MFGKSGDEFGAFATRSMEYGRMRRNVRGIAGLLLCVTPLGARAQSPGIRPQTSPFPRPAVSPYLNMARGGSPALNYYNLVRPQQDTQTAILQLQQQSRATTQLIQTPPDAILTTGHPSRFLNYSHYFYSNLGAQGPLNMKATTPLPYPLPTQHH